MIDLTEMAEFVDRSGPDGLVMLIATASKDGAPDISFKGSFMVWDARRLRLCARHFAAEPPGPGVSTGACPAGGQSRGRAC